MVVIKMPNILSKYAVPGLEYRLETLRTDTKPFLVAITAGQQNGKTLVFHFKIRDKYYEYVLRKVNATSCNFACREKSCPGTIKMKCSL